MRAATIDDQGRRGVRRTALGAVVALLLAAPFAVATDDPQAEADRHFAAQAWPEAAAAYERVVAADPAAGEAWRRLGVCRRQLGRYPEALDAFRRALDAGAMAGAIHAGIASVHVAAGDLDAAFAALRAAFAAGMPTATARTLPAFAPLTADPRFEALLAEVDAAAFPCESRPEYRALDFWIGDWEAHSGGQVIGRNRIRRDLRGCVIVEQWESPGGSGKGMSLNFFDPRDGRWHQHWVSENGTVVEYEGGPDGAVFRYSGEAMTAAGSRSLSRVLLEPQADGTVHHVIDRSSDGGATWGNVFDAVYKPSA